MKYPIDKKYYINRKPELIKKFEEDLRLWSPLIHGPYGEINAYRIIQETRQAFNELISQIPYIGGDENRYTGSLVESARYLAFYQAMKKHGKTAEEAGRILYKAILTLLDKPRPPIPSAEKSRPEQLDERRRKGAEQSQKRRYPGDYVYTFIPGNGTKFDHGYDFTECASLKFYRAQGAEEFMPFYCYLDFPLSKVNGAGLTRTLTMSLGAKKCNHRSKAGRETKAVWPPPFLKRMK